MNDVHCAFGPHHGEFCRWPCHVVVALQVLARHGEVSASVGFASDEGEFWNGGFGVGKQQLGSVANDAAPLLNNTGQESGDVLKGDKWDVERVACSDKTGGFD